jgi:hypothetical protein
MWCLAAFYVVYPYQFLMAVIYARGGSGTNINCIYIQLVSDLILLPVKSVNQEGDYRLATLLEFEFIYIP